MIMRHHHPPPAAAAAAATRHTVLQQQEEEPEDEEPLEHSASKSQEENENDSNTSNNHHAIFSYPSRSNPRLCFSSFFFEPHQVEANGLVFDVFARAPVGMASLFLGPALLDLATEAAGCDISNDADEAVPCDNLIHGFRPSSLLTNLATVSGLLGCLFLPLFGSIIDHTPYRRAVGAWTALGLSVIKGLEVMVSQKTWFVVAHMQILSGLMYFVHITASYAYVSELSNDGCHISASYYNTWFSIVSYVSTLLFMIEVMALSAIFDTDDVGTARISQTLTAMISAPCFYYAWVKYLPSRPRRSQVAPGDSLWLSGFSKLMRTSRHIHKHYQSLQYLMVAIAFGEAASAALVSIATTYMKNVLDMDAKEIGLVFFIVLITGIPGSCLGNFFTEKLGNPVYSVMVVNLIFIVSTGAASGVLKGPDDKHQVYLFGMFWGIALGWMSPQHTASFVPIIPKQQESELMGMYLLCVQILTWLPPMIFTALNERGLNMSYGLASLDIFFAMAIVSLVFVVDYKCAVENAQQLHEQSSHHQHVELSKQSEDNELL